jgi:hypothetical protein
MFMDQPRAIGLQSVPDAQRCRRDASEYAHDGHAYCDTESHLREDDRLPSIGHSRVDLHAPVQRARVHHDSVGFGTRELLGRQSIRLEELACAWQKRAIHALVL